MYITLCQSKQGPQAEPSVMTLQYKLLDCELMQKILKMKGRAGQTHMCVQYLKASDFLRN